MNRVMKKKIKRLQDHFKNREEVEKYFGDEVFKFVFITDNTMMFETLNPRIVDDMLVRFNLSFYYEDCGTFFAYSSFKEFLDRFQLSDIVMICEYDGSRTPMFFRQYVEATLT